MSALAAALIGAAGPFVIARLPEPQEPDPDKPAYAVIARPVWLAPFLAAAAAGSAALVARTIDLPELMPAWVLVCGVGSWLGYIDARTKLLPYVIVAPLYLATALLVGLAALLAGEPRILLHALVANVIVFVVFRILYAVGRGAFGYGDVRLSGVLALVLGPLGASSTVVGLYAAFLLGAVCGLVLTILKVVDRQAFAFGPYMLVGAVVGAVWGPRLYGS